KLLPVMGGSEGQFPALVQLVDILSAQLVCSSNTALSLRRHFAHRHSRFIDSYMVGTFRTGAPQMPHLMALL
ncbi:MAG: hypothetical protein ACPL7O_04145, partial [Armatimonadota bacterium]